MSFEDGEYQQERKNKGRALLVTRGSVNLSR